MAFIRGAGVANPQHLSISTLVPQATILLCMAAASVFGASPDGFPSIASGSNSTLTPRLIFPPNPAAVPFPFQTPQTVTPRPVTTAAMVTSHIGLGDSTPTATTPTVRGTGAAMAANSDTMKLTPQAVQAGENMNKPPKKAFLGGIPTPELDVPVTVIFLILFGLGAFVHMSIYRANSKRGHKFRLSGLMFDFCMVRVVTAIFRIIWAFLSLTGIIVTANIFQNGGAVVVFAINLFFGQRLVRAMHPSIGWHPVFSRYSLFLIWTCPAVTIMNAIAVSISAFSVGKPAQLHSAETVLKVGASWNMMLAVTPLLWVFVASAKPGPQPENFGQGDFRAKAALLVFSAATMAVGAAVRLTISANEKVPDFMVSKETLYTTQFMLECLTVAAYAYFRIDLIFHIPNGASRSGDYSLNSKDTGFKPQIITSDDIEREIGRLGARYEILKSSSGGKQGPVMALLYPASAEKASADSGKAPAALPRYPKLLPQEVTNKALPPIRPPRATRTTFYMTKNSSAVEPSPTIASPKMFV